MRQWLCRRRIKLITWLLILATFMSAGISIYLAGQQQEEKLGGTGQDGYGNSGDD